MCKDVFIMFIERKRTNPINLITTLVVSSLLLSGWTGSWNDIQKEAENIESISSTFTQTKQMHILSKPLVSKGKFFFENPDSVRWEYTSPVKSILLMHKGTVKKFIYESQSFTEDQRSYLQSINVMLQEISLWTKGQFNTNKNFIAEFISGDVSKIILTPKDKSIKQIIERIEIVLMPNKSNIIESITISEGEGNYTLFEFSNIEINKQIDDSIFQHP